MSNVSSEQPDRPTPNAGQTKLIESLDGTYLVDAGAGTGKTFAITRRYANILATTDASPDDILLITFTRNAATEMKDRIVGQCDYSMAELADAPIQTFHSLCHDILQNHGFDAPTRLGIDERIPSSTRIIEDDIVEEALFSEFFEQFVDDHPEYTDLIRVVSDPLALLGLINQLASKGVFPTSDGWYRDSGQYLDGDFEAFKRQFDTLNEPRNGGSKQSRLRSKLYQYGKNKCYLPEAPSKAAVRGDGKQVPEELAQRVFAEDREDLKGFVHDVYFEYLEFALSRNYLNFGFLQLFAFVLLYEDHALRDRLEYEYLMIDEFQDSSEIQFKLGLLLAGTDNICVVGDWKQSIYSFQYAAVENILDFRQRLTQFAADLNDDVSRITYDTSSVQTIELTQNYRSTQRILDFSEEGLVTPAATYDSFDADEIQDRIVSLDSNTEHENSRIEAYQHEDEHEAVLTKIQDVVGNSAYQVRDENGELRDPEYRDIAVLTRTRDFGRELQAVADDHDFPMAYDGGIELFRTDQAKLLLAWLRILDSNADRGWAPVLERAGYTLDEIDHILETESYPADMRAFRDSLASLESLGGVMRKVFDRYGFDGSRADVLLHTINSIRDTTTLTVGDLIRFIARGIEHGSTHEINTSAATNSVTVQTIHATKGLEHPIVILANMNNGRFPPSGGRSPTIMYDDAAGLRQRKTFANAHGDPYIYDNWKADVLTRCLNREYDEERRLLYVSITRAENHVLFTAGDDPNTFLDELPVDIQPGTADVEDADIAGDPRPTLTLSIPDEVGPTKLSPHSLMDTAVYEDVEDGMGTEFGTQVHDFAEAYVLGADVVPRNTDEEHVQQRIDSLPGELRPEQQVYLPMTTDSGDITLSGAIDLLHITPDSIDIIDYKTDRGRHAESEYRKQLSVYYHVLDALYPERAISTAILYTETGSQVDIEPLSESALRTLVENIRNPDST
ncbi:ATP-dependent exoDNAse (exonuclease V) beta subunit (contains helicase and exonuclease domains) [Halapricum desulfuricans]|uniref:DNA 3'-5' helicase n=1 Tax=Halapricum desulfuricans TaxID=2841257 RepID=A0A897NJ97_9EURY|nr:UvrD-helicase domain-containing protein [Halapricum desulfuricans]QSG11525.1 ATP-dependent exoDNAse (exonuclease V) beta subunit (contains helicase and exonuclease domains) [Halapricum desulfuricans]